MTAARILIVDDETIVALDIQERLTSLGYAWAGTARTGEQALTLAERERPDLVLMDIRLQSEMDGITAACQIRERLHLPVVFLTANSEDAALERAKRAEPYGYILKPFDDRELKSTLEIALYKHQAEQEIRRLNRLYEVLSQVNQAIVRSKSQDELLSLVCRLVVEHGQMNMAWIGWLDPATNRIVPHHQFGNETGYLEAASFFACESRERAGNPGLAVLSGQAFVCNDCDRGTCPYPAEHSPARFGFQSCGSFPIRLGDKICGVLSVGVSEAGFFADREISLLNEVAMDISFALDKFEGDARRRRAEEEARLSSERWQLTFDAISDPVALLVPDGSVLQSKRAFAAKFGPADEGCEGQKCFQAVHGITEFLSECPLARAVQNGTREELEMAVDDKIYLVAVDPIWAADGQVTGVVHVMRDVTERVRAEAEVRQLNFDLERRVQRRTAELEAANRELDAFSYSVSHDLRAPLRAVDGFAGILVSDYQDQLDDEGRRVLGVVQSQTRYMGRLIDDLLRFSRLGRHPLQKIQVDMEQLVGEVVREVRNETSGRAIEFRLGRLPTVTADVSLLRQVWLNLLANAVKFSRSRDPAVIEVAGTLEKDEAVFSVRDNGVGFDIKFADKLFKVFQRLHGPDEFEGTGVGLSLVQRIIQRHDGRVWATAELDQGATFGFSLPHITPNL
jgi:hypothetical protein